MNRHHRAHRRWPWYLAGVLLAGGGTVAALLFSPAVRITGVDVTGARTIAPDDVAAAVADTYRIPSVAGFNPDRARAHLLDAFPQLADATVARDWPHRISVTLTEREPLGTWCHVGGVQAKVHVEELPRESPPSISSCTLWDRTGARWGTAAPSVGPLLLLVRDERSEGGGADLLAGMLTAVDGLPALGVHARSVTLPDAEPGGVRITTDKGYELYLDALGDVAGQLDTLDVFLTDRADDPAFHPLYVDLRTPGRVYFR